MPAVIEATATAARQAPRRDTPARLRLWVIAAVLTAAALLVATSLLMARVHGQVRTIGTDAAPQAAAAADLYFALSDMDAQVARMVLTAGREDLAGSQIDALGAYRERSRQVDAGLQLFMAGDADRATVLAILDDLATYRERVWQALTAGAAAPGYYTQATNVLHLDLLPAAERLREASEARLDRAYASRSATQAWAVVLAVLLGGALLALLLGLQVWLARTFRRMLNPALIGATVLTVALLVPLLIVLTVQGRQLGAAREESLEPYLALSRARAVSYDAAADTSRYLISDDLALYRADFARKADCLDAGRGCRIGLPQVAAGPDVSPYATGQVLERWAAYRKGHDRIVALAAAGREAEAIRALTGIRRGDAAFDFSYYDAAVGEITDARRDAFDDAMHEARTLTTGWPVIPVAVLGLVALLVPVAVRKRFAEYR